MPAAARDAWLAWYATHARRALHRDLLDQPGRRRLQGLRPHLPRGAALARDDAGREARDLAPHHAWKAPPGASTATPSAPARRTAGADAAQTPAAARAAAAPRASTRLGLRRGARRIAPLAWPVFVGQVAVLAFSTVDTVLVARHVGDSTSPRSRSARAAYISVFIGLMGVVLAVGPIAGQLYGAGKLLECGARGCTRRCGSALALSVLGCALLLFPEPFLALSQRRARGRRQGARLPRRPGVRAAGGAAVHRLPRLQHRGVAAEGGDGAAARRRWR